MKSSKTFVGVCGWLSLAAMAACAVAIEPDEERVGTVQQAVDWHECCSTTEPIIECDTSPVFLSCCPAPAGECAGTTGKWCVDKCTDEDNCGSCGNVCAGTDICCCCPQQPQCMAAADCPGRCT